MIVVKKIAPLWVAASLLFSTIVPTLAFQTAVQTKAVVYSTSRTSSEHSRRHSTVLSESSSRDDFDTPVPEIPAETPLPQSVPPQPQTKRTIDPLVASLTRIDEPTPDYVPSVQTPLLGEIPADGNLALLAPAAGIAVLGFIFSIVVAFNSRDAFVEELSAIELPKMEYTPTVVEDGKCRGLCADQEKDLEGLRGFMDSLGK
mmetsp:Transcript_15287/g.32155  ORF Transcript_15287/g.32155 Transcript_15287/m.32155 type:complete len:202 (+) Transcript_15287:83-688(+)|eukprot:CAMPEP_0171341706 /NCGR_PEP_ID=MMETSP0878-20121228/11454_1 /TAXON_ID=67004 /ORGANISM="Thalassiosira weissflogii, Strain CCMP1336" /LENGTH=201 /DNA_ID=CAMNT_0011844077 /DNA_START=10 /DNA_END=615 /DNA_ORIENTATION=-